MLCRADKCVQRATIGPYCFEHGCRGKRCHERGVLDGLCPDHLSVAFGHWLDGVNPADFERITAMTRERDRDAR